MEHAVLPETVFTDILTLLRDWIPQNAAIAIAYEGRYVFFSSPLDHIHLPIGATVQSDSIAYQVLQTNKKVDAMMDNSLFDTPYYAIGYPLTFQHYQLAIIVVMPSTFKLTAHEPYQFITGRLEEDWIPVSIEEITYIESLNKHTWFYDTKQQYKTTITLKELETRLPKNFLRIHRSFIINTYCIQKISKDIAGNYVAILKTGAQLPISQSYFAAVKKAFQF